LEWPGIGDSLGLLLAGDGGAQNLHRNNPQPTSFPRLQK